MEKVIDPKDPGTNFSNSGDIDTMKASYDIWCQETMQKIETATDEILFKHTVTEAIAIAYRIIASAHVIDAMRSKVWHDRIQKERESKNNNSNSKN